MATPGGGNPISWQLGSVTSTTWFWIVTADGVSSDCEGRRECLKLQQQVCLDLQQGPRSAVCDHCCRGHPQTHRSGSQGISRAIYDHGQKCIVVVASWKHFYGGGAKSVAQLWGLTTGACIAIKTEQAVGAGLTTFNDQLAYGGKGYFILYYSRKI